MTAAASPSRLFSEALVQHRAGRFADAEALYRAVIADEPSHIDALTNLGALRLQQGRNREAADFLTQALALNPTYAPALVNRGGALQNLRRYDEALADYDNAILAEPANGVVHDNRGLALLELQRAGEALASFDRALEHNPDYAPAHLHRGNTLRALKRLVEALHSYDRALALAPDNPEVLNNRGVVLFDLGRVEEALASHEAACRSKPDYADAICSRGAALQELGRFQEALACYDAALALRPTDTLAAFNKSHLKLLLGDFREGWALHEVRWQAPTIRPRFPRREPLWLGKEDIAGKTVLLQAEQGFGDVVQFCRFAPEVARLGATVIVEVQKELFRLVSTLAGVTVIARGDPLPHFDCACPMMSLPFALKTTLTTIPSKVPYLHADPAAVAAWREKRGPGRRRRIGLAWSGYGGFAQNHKRSMSAAACAPLLDCEAEFHSLQKEIAPGDRAWLDANGVRVHDRDLGDFADTAALIANMDLVVTVDTSIAHVAGATAMPVWVLLSHVPDFRWLTGRSDSPWYPTARLFRQPSRGDWDAVMNEVLKALRALP